MKSWTPERVAAAAGARLITPVASALGPTRVTIDSRDAGPGALFVGLPGGRVDGGAFASQALAAGAWGVLCTPEHLQTAGSGAGALIASGDPLAALQQLATAWRLELGAKVIAVTGSTGKTSTKELLLAVLSATRRTVASRANFNTEIGLPLEILAAPTGTEVLVLEMGMRGAGQIAELAEIARPDVGVIVSIGPAHLEQLGTLEAIAAAKAELIAALDPGATAVIPAGERLLSPHIRPDLRTITFGDGGDVSLISGDADRVEIDLSGEWISLEVSFTQAHLRHDLLAALAATDAIGVEPPGAISLPENPGRGRHLELADRVELIDDCYNANPMSMRAALDDLAATAALTPGSRSVAVLGDMLELGGAAAELHREIGAYANAAGIELLVTVGPQAAAIAEQFDGESHSVGDAGEAAGLIGSLLAPGDVVLVKGSRGIRLERVCEALTEAMAR